jgi:hypothetical protein
MKRHSPAPLGVRPTYRTLRVLVAIGEMERRGSPPSNREVAKAADVGDEGQASRLLKRLWGLGLVENTGVGQSQGGPNAWGLTARGEEALRELEGRFGRHREAH